MPVRGGALSDTEVEGESANVRCYRPMALHLSTPSAASTPDAVAASGLRPAAPSMTAERLRRAVLDDRRRTIAAILKFNPKADAAFLSQFRTAPLKDYLEHLRHARHKHVRLAGWLQQRTAKRAAAPVRLAA